MRYKIVIEIDTESSRMAVNRLAMEMKDLAVTSWCNPVFLSTEIKAKVKDILVGKEQ